MKSSIKCWGFLDPIVLFVTSGLSICRMEASYRSIDCS